jgi:hypothetical protein
MTFVRTYGTGIHRGRKILLWRCAAALLGFEDDPERAITSHALDTKQTFPFVTIPHFEIRGSDLHLFHFEPRGTRRMTHLELIEFCRILRKHTMIEEIHGITKKLQIRQNDSS